MEYILLQIAMIDRIMQLCAVNFLNTTVMEAGMLVFCLGLVISAFLLPGKEGIQVQILITYTPRKFQKWPSCINQENEIFHYFSHKGKARNQAFLMFQAHMIVPSSSVWQLYLISVFLSHFLCASNSVRFLATTCTSVTTYRLIITALECFSIP